MSLDWRGTAVVACDPILLMKHMLARWLFGGLLAGWMATSGAWAQGLGMPGSNLGFNAAVATLFNNIPAFGASVEVGFTNKSGSTRMQIPMRMLKRDKDFRMEVDLARIRGSGLAMQGLTGMQNIGMARMVSLVLPKEQGMLVLFPDLKFHTRVELSEADLAVEGFKVAKRAAGKETVNGQACVRQEVTLTAGNGEKTQATTWEATGLGNFPVRMLFRGDDQTMVMNFSQVSLTPPAEDQFRVPKDFTGFNSIAGLMQEALTKALAGPGGR